MNILHLCSYYIGNKLYKNLIYELSNKRNIFQNIYIPIKDGSLINTNVFKKKNVSFFYDKILFKYHRIFYGLKIRKQKIKVERKFEITKLDMIHAHTLFSDGGTAYLLNQKYGTRYVVSVRNTDINVFYKYALHYRRFSHEILKNANAIVFISPAYKKKLFDLLPSKVIQIIEPKTYVIPNGMNYKWLETPIPSTTPKKFEPLKLIFVGSLDSNKNLTTVLSLISKVNSKIPNVRLDVVGDGPLMQKHNEEAKRLKVNEQVMFHGQVEVCELIKLIDDATIFILPSFRETFGISYIEAMSRGKPVLYTKNEGIDGYFPEGKIGYSSAPTDIEQMIENIYNILQNYEDISRNCIEESKSFNWKEIADKYEKIYKNKE